VCGIASSNKRMNQLNVKSEPCYLTDLSIDESELNKHELNIDQKNITILNDEHQFAVPNAVPPQIITCIKNDPSSTTFKNESVIDAHELNVDEKNFSLLNRSSTNIPGLAEVSSTLNPLELNVDSKSITLLNMSTAMNQSSLLLNESSLNPNELNIDSRLGNMSNSRLLVNESNVSSGSTTIDALERNIDVKNITFINASQSTSHQNRSKIIENQRNLVTNESQNSSGL